MGIPIFVPLGIFNFIDDIDGNIMSWNKKMASYPQIPQETDNRQRLAKIRKETPS